MQRRDRPAARLVVVDESGSVLLLRVDDPLSDETPFWITPGGGLEPGETAAEAASRELAEETGLAVAPEALGEPIAISRGDWEFRGQPFYSESWHFAVVTKAFELDDSGWDEFERQFHSGWRWWTTEELEATEERVVPDHLADLVRRIAAGAPFGPPLDLDA